MEQPNRGTVVLCKRTRVDARAMMMMVLVRALIARLFLIGGDLAAFGWLILSVVVTNDIAMLRRWNIQRESTKAQCGKQAKQQKP